VDDWTVEFLGLGDIPSVLGDESGLGREPLAFFLMTYDTSDGWKAFKGGYDAAALIGLPVYEPEDFYSCN
jgi:hypothetical protein